MISIRFHPLQRLKDTRILPTPSHQILQIRKRPLLRPPPSLHITSPQLHTIPTLVLLEINPIITLDSNLIKLPRPRRPVNTRGITGPADNRLPPQILIPKKTSPIPQPLRRTPQTRQRPTRLLQNTFGFYRICRRNAIKLRAKFI